MKALLIALLLSSSAMAQPPLTPQEYDPFEAYYFQRASGSYVHPVDGGEVLLVIVRSSTGKYYRVPMRPENAEGLLLGDEVVIAEPQKYFPEDLREPIP